MNRRLRPLLLIALLLPACVASDTATRESGDRAPASPALAAGPDASGRAADGPSAPVGAGSASLPLAPNAAERARILAEYRAESLERARPRPTLRARLAAERVPAFHVRDEDSLSAVVQVLRNQTGLPLVVAPGAEDAAFDDGAAFAFDLSAPLRARDLLDLIAQQAGDGVRWVVRHDTVLFTTRDKARGELVLVAHDIRTLTAARTDFIAPRIDRIRLLDDLEDDDGGGPFGGVGESVVAMEAESVATLVQENIAVGTWEDEGVSIEPHEGQLFVRHSAEVQQQVALFLAALGA